MEFNPDLPGFDGFLYWHSQRTGSHNFEWDDPNHRNAYLAWEQQTRKTMSGTEATPPHAPRAMMMAPQTPVAPRASGLPQDSDDSRGSNVQMYPQYENAGQVASNPQHRQQNIGFSQRQSEVQSQQKQPSKSQAAQPAGHVASDTARKVKGYEKEWTVLNKAHSWELSAFDKKQFSETSHQPPGSEQLRARDVLLQRHRNEQTKLKEDMEPKPKASIKAYKAAKRALDKSQSQEVNRFDVEHGFRAATWLGRLSWKPEQIMAREALQQKHRAENKILKEKHGISNDSLREEAGEKGNIKHATNGPGSQWSKTSWQSLRDRYGNGGQWFQDEVRAAGDLLPHFKKIWLDTLEIHIKAMYELNSGLGTKLSKLPRGSTASQSIKQKGTADRIAMFENQKESRKWIFEESEKELGRLAATQPGPEAEMKSPKLVAAMNYYTGATAEQSAAYVQYNPNTMEIDNESQAEDKEATAGYEPHRPDAVEIENRPKYIEEIPTAPEQQKTDCIDVETEEPSEDNGQLGGPQQNTTSNDTLPVNSTLVLHLGTPSSSKGRDASKAVSEEVLLETLPSDLKQRLNQIKDSQAKELRDFDEPFFAMMRNAEGDPSERARASIQWNANRAEILEKHKQALEIVQTSQIDKDKVSAEEHWDRTWLDETIRPDEGAGQQIISPGGPNNNANVFAEDSVNDMLLTGTSGPDEKLWRRRVELEARIGFNGGIDISNMVRDEEPPYPRCSRCLNLKKGCDRQRPCRRCLDAGLPANQCVTRKMDKKPRKTKGRQLQNQSIQNQSTESILPPTATRPNIKVEHDSDENLAHPPAFQQAGNQTYGLNPTHGQQTKLALKTPERLCSDEQVNGRPLEPHLLTKLEGIIKGQKETEEHQQGILATAREFPKALKDSPLVYRYVEGLGFVPSAGSTTNHAQRGDLSLETIIELENLEAIQLCEKTVCKDIRMQRIAKAKPREERKLAEDNAGRALFELGEAHKQQLDKISKVSNVPTGNQQVLAIPEGNLSGGVGQRPAATSMKDPPPENNLLNYSVCPIEKAGTITTNPLSPKSKKGAGDIKKQAVTEYAPINLFPDEFHEELRLLERAQTREMNDISSRGWRTFLSPEVNTKRFAKEKKQQLVDETLVEHAKTKHEFVQKALKKKDAQSESSIPPPQPKSPRLERGKIQPMEEPTDLSSPRFTDGVTAGQRYDTSQKTRAEAEQHCVDSLAEEFRNSMGSLMKAQAYELAVVRKFHGERCDKAHKAEPDKKAVLLKKREEALILLQDKHEKQREELTKRANEKKRALSRSSSPTRPVKIPRLTGECQLLEEPSDPPLRPSRFTKTRQRRSGSVTAKYGSEPEAETQLREEIREGGKQGHVANNTQIGGQDQTLLKQGTQEGNGISTGAIQDRQGQFNEQPSQLPIIQPAVENSSSGSPPPGCPEDELQAWIPEPLGREAALVRAAQYDLARIDWRQAVEDSSADVMDDSKWIGDDLLSVLEICTSKLGGGGEVL
jgi:hypothetical protein